MCYFCGTVSSAADEILFHTICKHSEENNFSLRQEIMNETTGFLFFKSIHFNVKISKLQQHYRKGFLIHLDIEKKSISFKRKLDTNEENHTISKRQNETTQVENRLNKLMADVFEKMKEIGRFEDFVSIMENIANETLLSNIAFHLLLDIGKFYAQQSISQMRYSQRTLTFWCTVYKLFKGKGINFFRGYKGEGFGEKGDVNPHDSIINFVVPSNPVLAKEVARFTTDAETPGILNMSLDAFSSKHSGKDIKLSIDGKKIAVGFGKHGDEDLDGDENPPTLKERQTRLAKEVDIVKGIKDTIEPYTVDDNCTLKGPEINSTSMKDALLLTIENISTRIRELRELIVKRKLHLQRLLNQVDGDWKTSNLSHAISYWQTKIIQSQSTIKDLLECTDKIGFTIACINGTDDQYVCGTNTSIHLELQSNYVCLKALGGDELQENADDPRITKQRSLAWDNLRKNSRITGSTIFKALGLDTLKEQQKHHDKVYKGIDEPISEDLQKMFDYGTEQEINAIGTLVGKILPVYFPNLVYRENGCEKIPLGDSYAVISGDGSGVNPSGEDEVAFEFKCPVPGKGRTTDVHYKLPVRYTTQVLSQMAAKQSSKVGYLSYTPESTTFIAGTYSPVLWEDIWNLCLELYSQANTTRPTKRHERVKDLTTKLQDYANSCKLVAEFPSLKAISCSCGEATSKENIFGNHISKQASVLPSLIDVSASLDKTESALNTAYDILRSSAKEVLVTVASDLDRMTGGYAVPIQYGLSGYSLHMSSVRKMLSKAVSACILRQLNVRVVAFDGQFLEIAVEDDNGQPLTVCRFMKKYWSGVLKLTKPQKLASLFKNYTLPRVQKKEDLNENFILDGNKIVLRKKIKHVGSTQNIAEALERKKKTSKEKDKADDDFNVEETENENEILQYLPTEVIEKLGEDGLRMIRLAGNRSTISTGKSTEQHTTSGSGNSDTLISPEQDLGTIMDTNNAVETDDATEEIATSENTSSGGSIYQELLPFHPSFADFAGALATLFQLEESPKWTSMEVETFKHLLVGAESINKNFVKAELNAILSLTQTEEFIKKLHLKVRLVNAMSRLYGDGTQLPEPEVVPKSLKCQVEAHIRSWNIEAINVAYAQMNFLDIFNKWTANRTFNGPWDIKTDSGHSFHIHQWYAQPSEICSNAVQPIVDPHHLLVNNRSKCCSTGMVGMNVRADAWWSVAETSGQNKTGLSVEIAKELRDRQSNAFAQTTFSEKVQEEMERNGAYPEAQWCQLIRNWYKAIDSGGISIDTRIKWLIEMRDFLIPFLRVGHFPPPGSHIGGMPMAQFEGFLTNVDRRLQLYALVDGSKYNQRAVTSLDSETFFSAFQVLLHLYINITFSKNYKVLYIFV